MKLTLEFTPEDFKANKGKTLDELINGGTKKVAKKTSKKEADEDDDTDEDEEADEDDDTDEDEEADEDDDTDVDADMIKETISRAVKAGNKAKVEALFTKYKAKTVSNLKEAQYPKFYAELNPLTKKKK